MVTSYNSRIEAGENIVLNQTTIHRFDDTDDNNLAIRAGKALQMKEFKVSDK